MCVPLFQYPGRFCWANFPRLVILVHNSTGSVTAFWPVCASTVQGWIHARAPFVFWPWLAYH